MKSNWMRNRFFATLVVAFSVFFYLQLPPSMLVQALQNNASALEVRRRVDMTARVAQPGARGHAMALLRRSGGKEIQQLNVDLRKLPPLRSFRLLADQVQLVVFSTNKSGHAEIRFVRGEPTSSHVFALPSWIKSVADLNSIQLSEMLSTTSTLSGSFSISKSDLKTAKSVEIINAKADRLLSGTFAPTGTGTHLVYKTLQLQAGSASPAATGTAELKVTAHQKLVDQEFKLIVNHLPQPGPYTLKLDGNSVALFSATTSGFSSINFRSQEVDGEASAAEAQTEIDETRAAIVDAGTAIASALSAGANVSRAQAKLTEANSKLAEAQATLNTGNFASAQALAETAGDSAEDAEELAEDGAARVNEPDGDNNDGDHNDGDHNDGDANNHDDGDQSTKKISIRMRNTRV